MNITMTITAGSPKELLSAIAGCYACIDRDITSARIEDDSNVPAPTPAATVPAQVPIATVPVQAPVVPVAPAPVFTIEQVGKAGADLIAADPTIMPKLLALLEQFGVQAVAELKPDQTGPFATALRGLGGKI